MSNNKKSSRKFIKGGISPLKGGSNMYNQGAQNFGYPPANYPQPSPPTQMYDNGLPPLQYQPDYQPQQYYPPPQPQYSSQQLPPVQFNPNYQPQQQDTSSKEPYSFFPFLGLNRIPWLICIILIIVPSLLYQIFSTLLDELNPIVLKVLSAFMFIYYVLFVPLISHYGLYIFGWYGIILMNW